ncbi:MAG TPA: alkaline phosphatase family protein [Solirubrobacterales bacterium]|nr:alkaline phosphatase family protein [Solirubrobacterales bacterium]
MKISKEDDGSEKGQARRCAGCGTGLSVSQRYCLECGARHGPLPAVVASRVDALRAGGRPTGSEAKGTPVAAADPVATGSERKAPAKDGRWDFMPSPQVAAVAVMALLAAGVVLGSVTSPLAQSAGVASIILDMGSGPSEGPPETTATSTPSVAAETPAFASTAEAPIAPPLEAPVAEPEPAPVLPPELPEEELLPEIKHVFLIVLDGHGYEEAFGETSSAPYLAKTLAGEGKLLSSYYAVAQGGLANEIALLSGQGPTPQTAVNCPEYTAIAPGTLSPEGQVEGSGCVYPSTTETLPKQLAAAKLSWKAYVEDIANGAAAGQPITCRHPMLGSADPSAAAIPGDAFQTWRNPFVYFAGLTESPECAEKDVGLDRLVPDLKKAEETPSFSYIVPSACHDGGETPCAPEQPAGLATVDGFLETVVPEITASPAYKEDGGLLAITFDQAPQTGPALDSSSCCGTPEYPNLPPPAPLPPGAEPTAPGPVKPSGGGGRVGMLLLSPYVTPGSIDETAYYNHFSFLRSVEELLGQEPLGYAADPVLTAFDSSVFDASPEESTVAPSPAGSGSQ